MSDTLDDDKLSQKLAVLETGLKSFLPPRLIAVMLEGARRNCLAEICILAAFQTVERIYLHNATQQSISYASAAAIFDPRDTSDFQPLLRVHKLLNSYSTELRKHKCQQLRICSDLFSLACATAGDLRTVAAQADFGCNTTDADFNQVVACFLPAYADSAVSSHATGQYRNLHGELRKARLKFSHISWDVVPDDMLLLVTRWELQGNKSWATEATQVTPETLHLAFADRFQLKREYYSGLRLKCSEEWRLDDRIIKHFHGLPAPRNSQTTHSIAHAIAFKDDFVPGTRSGLEKVQELKRLREWADPSLPVLTAQAYYDWLVPRLGNACTSEELEQLAPQLTLSWSDIEQLTGSSDLEQRVADAALRLPQKVMIGGDMFEPEYWYRDKVRTVTIYAQEHYPALCKATDDQLPCGWDGLQIKIKSSQNDYLDVIRVFTAGTPFFAEVRRELAALSERISMGSHDLMKRNGVMLRKIQVNHPGYCEHGWVVAGHDRSYFTDYQEALQVALRDLKTQLTRFIEQELRRHSVYWSSVVIDILANQTMPLVNNDFSNLAVLRDYITEAIARSLRPPDAEIREAFQQLVQDLRNRGEAAPAGRLLCFEDEAVDALEQGNLIAAEELLAKAKTIWQNVPHRKLVKRST